MLDVGNVTGRGKHVVQFTYLIITTLLGNTYSFLYKNRFFHHILAADLTHLGVLNHVNAGHTILKVHSNLQFDTRLRCFMLHQTPKSTNVHVYLLVSNGLIAHGLITNKYC